MNSKERLLNVLQGKKTDRVPVSTYELVGWNTNSFENQEPSYKRLMDYIRKNTDCMYMIDSGYEPFNGIEGKEESWAEGDSVFTRHTIPTPKGDLTKLLRVDKNIHTTWTLEHLFKTPEDMDKYLSLNFVPREPVLTDYYKAKKELGEDKGMVLFSIADPVCELAGNFEFSEFTIQSVLNKEKIKHFLDVIFEMHYAYLEKLLNSGIKDCLFRICGPEYCTPPYLSPEYFRDFIVEYDKKLIELIRKKGMYSRIHSHGKIGKVVDLIGEMGPDALDPVEPIPDGDISLKDVKERIGSKICLMGNMELKYLEFCTGNEIDTKVKEMMDAAKENGRFVIMPTAAPINVPLSSKTEQNYIKFIDAALKYGEY